MIDEVTNKQGKKKRIRAFETKEKDQELWPQSQITNGNREMDA